MAVLSGFRAALRSEAQHASQCTAGDDEQLMGRIECQRSICFRAGELQAAAGAWISLSITTILALSVIVANNDTRLRPTPAPQLFPVAATKRRWSLSSIDMGSKRPVTAGSNNVLQVGEARAGKTRSSAGLAFSILERWATARTNSTVQSRECDYLSRVR